MTLYAIFFMRFFMAILIHIRNCSKNFRKTYFKEELRCGEIGLKKINKNLRNSMRIKYFDR